jgi:hypothetical protein
MQNSIIMKKHILLFLMVLFPVSGIISGQKPGNPDEYIWLHVEGPYIRRSPECTDPNGIWMGCGMARKTSIPRPTKEQAEFFAKWCKKNHFNLARIRWDLDSVSSNVIKYTIDPYLKALKDQKIYAVLDCHSDMRDGWDAENPSGRCRTWLNNWFALAEYYKDEPWIMGYELNNEPRLNSAVMVRDLYMKCLKTIRQVDRRHIIILGSYNWSHARGSAATWEEGLPGEQQFRPDEPYNQVVFNFHEYPQVKNRGGYPVYTANETSRGITAEHIARIQEKYKVPFMCTEFGVKANNENPPTVSEARRHEQEIIELCYGMADFWKIFKGPDKAWPPRGIPRGAGFQSWLAWWDYNQTEDTYKSFVFCKYMDILSWAAKRQASPAPRRR